MATQKTAASTKETAPDMAPVKKIVPSSILTIDADSEIETPESREDIVWHEFQNAYRTKKVLTGTLGGIEKMDQGGMIAVIYYKEMRVVIPMAEMMSYAIDLRSMTQSRGSFTFHFVRYEDCPPAAQEKAIAEAKALQAAEEK